MRHLLSGLTALGILAGLSAAASASHVLPELDPVNDVVATALVPSVSPIQLARHGHCHQPRHHGHYRGYRGYGGGYGYGAIYRPARQHFHRGHGGYRSYGYRNSLYGYGPGLNVGRGGGFSLYIGF